MESMAESIQRLSQGLAKAAQISHEEAGAKITNVFSFNKETLSSMLLLLPRQGKEFNKVFNRKKKSQQKNWKKWKKK
ncbi:hypothetical protein [Metabacillus fastidiosus]|uniref:hypothetical protein n=1 Tax=Metabacillus fastidiosus TaxID=1458 RepID=UPI002E24982F|nr:hypothetical protein [Metabacillus fastidiosus]